jgi:hypothetical protein
MWKIAAYTDDVLLLPCLERRDEGHIPREVQFSKGAQLFVGEALFGLEKAKIDGPAAQALEQVEEALLVVGPDRSDVDGATITQECVRGIVARFCHTHQRPPWHLDDRVTGESYCTGSRPRVHLRLGRLAPPPCGLCPSPVHADKMSTMRAICRQALACPPSGYDRTA